MPVGGKQLYPHRPACSHFHYSSVLTLDKLTWPAQTFCLVEVKSRMNAANFKSKSWCHGRQKDKLLIKGSWGMVSKSCSEIIFLNSFYPVE